MAGLLVGADVAARLVVEAQVEDQVGAAVEAAGPTEARIESFPFLPRLLASGAVARVRVAVSEVAADPFTFARVSVDLRQATFDRSRLASGGDVVLTGLGKGTATAELTEGELSRRVGLPVRLTPGRIEVEVAGQMVGAEAEVSDNVLRITVAGVRVPVLRIPRLDVLPCVADARIEAGRVRLTCQVAEVPPSLRGQPLGDLAS